MRAEYAFHSPFWDDISESGTKKVIIIVIIMMMIIIMMLIMMLGSGYYSCSNINEINV